MWEQLLRAPRASKFKFDGHPWKDWDCLCDYCDAYPEDLDEELDRGAGDARARLASVEGYGKPKGWLL